MIEAVTAFTGGHPRITIRGIGPETRVSTQYLISLGCPQGIVGWIWLANQSIGVEFATFDDARTAVENINRRN